MEGVLKLAKDVKSGPPLHFFPGYPFSLLPLSPPAINEGTMELFPTKGVKV